MKILKPDNLALLFTPCMTGDICCISVAAMACFSFDKSLADPLLAEQEMWQTVAAELGEEEALDMGLPKQRGEFLVYGSCHSPTNVTGMQVSVTVAGLSKTLNVSGDRYWNAAGIPSTPEPFTSKRISWNNAFGGEEWEPNPAGIGIARDKNGRIPVPLVQDQRHLVTSYNDRPEPAGFNALNPFWPQRKKYLGTFDDNWLKNRWPHYPHDTDPEYFNTAPPDQRLSGFFKGDEAIRIANMNPAKPEIVSKLPGVRSRLFINRIIDGKEMFSEITARCETLWLFPGGSCGVILFRGVSRVTDETLDDVTHLMAEWEPLNTPPESLEFYHRKFLEAISPAEAEVVEPPPVTAPPPQPEPLPSPALELPKPPPDPEVEKKMAELNALIAKADAQADAAFAKLGTTRAEAMAKYASPPKSASVSSISEMEKMIVDMQHQVDAVFKKMGMTAEEATKKYLSPQAAPKDPQQAIKTLTDALLKAEAKLKESGVNIQEAATRMMPASDPSSFDFGKIIAGLQGLAAAITPKVEAALPTPEKPEEAVAEPVAEELPDPAEELKKRIQQGKNLTGLDLSGMDFSGRDLSYADFSGSILVKTIFVGAVLKGAVFADTLLDDADFTNARMGQAKLVRVQAVGAKLTSVDLTSADISESDFTGCDFSGTVLTGATVSGALFAGASLRDIRGAGLTAVKSSFPKADLSGANLHRAVITASDFSNANLDNVCFVEAEASQATFDGAKGKGTDFTNAKMTASQADKDTLFSCAIFSGADMSRSCWERARLSDTRMTNTILDQTDFSRVVLDRAYMLNAIARETNFLKAIFTNCDLRGVNFFKASFRRARLTGCDLKNSNMFGADLYGAKIVESDIKGADFRRVLVESAE